MANIHILKPPSGPLPDDAPQSKSGSDTLFQRKKRLAQDFSFNHQVASVFDDMVERSVPLYGEIQRMILEIAEDFATDGTNVYDLGCATGTTLAGLQKSLTKKVSLIGVDNSGEMLARCKEKLKSPNSRLPVTLLEADLNAAPPIDNASVVVLILTLQFVRPLRREALIKAIYEGLNHQGCLILVEKILGENSDINRLFIEYYYRLKRRRGYSDMEIAQKREALENVLVPYKLMENRELVLKTGFRSWDVFFTWYNFCGMIAIK